jgi:hypothetical protein
MKRRDQGDISPELDLDSVSELGSRSFAGLWLVVVTFVVESESADRGIEGQASKRDDDAYSAQQVQLAKEVRAAVRDLRGQRFVFGRRAANGRRHVTIKEFQSIVAIFRCGLICEARFVQGSKEPIAASVTGEDSAGSISAVSGRRESDDQDSRGSIAEAWDRTAPVVLIPEAPDFFLGDAFAPFDQPRTLPTFDDLLLQQSYRFTP